jgi:hypothetical protein
MQSPVGTSADHLPLEFLKEIPKIVRAFGFTAAWESIIVTGCTVA